MLVAGSVHARALAVHLARASTQMLETEAGVELQIHYRASSIVTGVRDGTRVPTDSWSTGPAPGDRVPDAGPLVNDAGGHLSLRDVLRGPRHTLLVLAGDADDENRMRYPDLLDDVTARLGDLVAGYLVVIADAPPRGAASILADPTLRVHGRLGAAADTLLLVRPDGYAAFRAEPPDPIALQTYLGTLFTGALCQRDGRE